jgi:hypothetical protein
MPANIFIRARGSSEILRGFIHAESFGKRPENPCIQDESLVRVRINGKIIRDFSAKAAVFSINGVIEPEGQDVGVQLHFYSLPKVVH